MTPAKMALYQRVTRVLGGFDATPDQRRKIIDGTGEADSWEQVPLGIQHLIVEIEKSPPQTWDDPADLPDQKGI